MTGGPLHRSVKEPLTDFRPLHTRAKSRDHEIVTAQKKVTEGRLDTPPRSCIVVTDPQV